jgi:hypothetical protein
MKTNQLRRRSINLDDITHQRCRMLAENSTLSISAWLRLMVKQIYEKQQAVHVPSLTVEHSGSPIDSGNR